MPVERAMLEVIARREADVGGLQVVVKESHVPGGHIQCAVAHDLLEGEDVAAVEQAVRSLIWARDHLHAQSAPARPSTVKLSLTGWSGGGP